MELTRESSINSVYKSIKLVIVGPSNSGKSSLFSRFTKNKFSDQTNHTIGIEYSSKIIKIDNTEVILLIVNTK